MSPPQLQPRHLQGRPVAMMMLFWLKVAAPQLRTKPAFERRKERNSEHIFGGWQAALNFCFQVYSMVHTGVFGAWQYYICKILVRMAEYSSRPLSQLQ
jgi:hypothetical protein